MYTRVFILSKNARISEVTNLRAVHIVWKKNNDTVIRACGGTIRTTKINILFPRRIKSKLKKCLIKR